MTKSTSHTEREREKERNHSKSIETGKCEYGAAATTKGTTATTITSFRAMLLAQLTNDNRLIVNVYVCVTMNALQKDPWMEQWEEQ